MSSDIIYSVGHHSRQIVPNRGRRQMALLLARAAGRGDQKFVRNGAGGEDPTDDCYYRYTVYDGEFKEVYSPRRDRVTEAISVPPSEKVYVVDLEEWGYTAIINEFSFDATSDQVIEWTQPLFGLPPEMLEQKRQRDLAQAQETVPGIAETISDSQWEWIQEFSRFPTLLDSIRHIHTNYEVVYRSNWWWSEDAIAVVRGKYNAVIQSLYADRLNAVH